MKSHTDAQRVNAFVDRELDLTSQLEIEERMRQDVGLREQVEDICQLRKAILESAEYHAAPAALRNRMAGLMAPKPTARKQLGDKVVAMPRWLGWRPTVASFGLMAVLVMAVNLAWLRPSHDDRLLDDVVASHVRSTLGQHLVDVASSDHHTVKPWLSSKLDFSPPVNELQIHGAVFLGGRVD